MSQRIVSWIIPMFVALCAIEAHAQLPPAFVLEWGSFGTTQGRLNEPYALHVDASGNVYVSDTVNNRIQKFDANGNFLLGWGSLGLGSGQFRDPVGLDTDAAGNIYVAEWTGDRVQKFTSSGTFITKWGSTGSGNGQFRTADDVCVDPDGDVFVADKNNHRIQKFTASGTFIRKWGSLGTAPGQFQYPVSVACDAAGNVYVAEQGGNRVQKFDGDGNPLDQWGSPGAGPGQFNEPIHIDLDTSDRVYVPDSKNHRIQVFEADGTFLAEWGTHGTGPGQFEEPEGLSVGADGTVYVADTHNHRVQKFFGTSSGDGCAACPPSPPANTARFRVGPALPVSATQFEVTLLVDTAEEITFTQMGIEFDDTCVDFVSASVGADVANAGAPFVLEAAGATDPGSNRHVQLNVTGEYGPGCGRRVFVLRFESLVGPAGSCRLVWDRDNPAGNPPNHLNTAENVQIRMPALAFCDLDGFDLRTTFRFGAAIPTATGVEVPLLVTTHDAVTFTQMTVEYDGDCVTFSGAVIGSGMTNAGSLFILDTTPATTPLLDRHVVVNATGEYGPGVDVEVFRLTFAFTGGTPPPCQLVWERTAPAGNAPNHLITSLPSVVRPEQIHFIDTAVASSCPPIAVTGRITYFGNGIEIESATPDAGSHAVTVMDCAHPANDDQAGDAAYELSFGNGPLAEICVCASRPKAACDDLEGGVLSGNDLILLQDFIAQIGPAPTPRQRLAADLNHDGQLLANDAMALKQWIGHATVCSTDKCTGSSNDNCAGVWQFIYPTGAGPSDFEPDRRCLTSVCGDREIDIEGILLGDVDASWPQVFPLAHAPKGGAVPLALSVIGWDGDVVTLALEATIAPGQALHHIVYSLEWDARAFAYEEATAGAAVANWGLFEHSDAEGVAHGIVHRLASMDPLRAGGEALRFRFRALTPAAASRFAFTRLTSNDFVIAGVGVEAAGRLRPDAASGHSFTLDIQPNPFNPTTSVGFTIPSDAGTVPVTVLVYDIAGRRVRTLLEGMRGPGAHEVIWNGSDDGGRAVGAGIYFVRCSAGDWSAVRRAALIK